MLRKIRIAMGYHDGFYRLQDLIEIVDVLIGGRRSGKWGRSAKGKSPVLWWLKIEVSVPVLSP
ncbi:hypothetical protein NTG1052_540035 [Candidatus Nitrotoga sp. 1052]|nr:hypothetical protein NTG1052_540035 [Candidatus Nitrotoga sp. 1052]